MINQKRCGFTLVEVMVVVAIIGILAAVMMSFSIPRAMRYRENAEIADKFRTVLQAFELYELENYEWPPSLAWSIPPEVEDYYFPYYGITNASQWGTQDDGSSWHWYYKWIGSVKWHVILLYQNKMTVSQAEELDSMLDDGVLTTGNFRGSSVGSNFAWLYYLVAEY